MGRISELEFYKNVLTLLAKRSTCLRHNVSAILVNSNGCIISTGYNGAPRGVKHCKKCLREILRIPSGQRQEICIGSHAEINAIVQAARYGISTDNSSMYCTDSPCSYCAKAIVNAGIRAVYYLKDYNDDLAKDILSQGKVKLMKIKE